MLPAVLFMCVYFTISECFQPIPTKVTPYTTGTADVGSPLFLTPLLRKGLYKRAQRLARVNPDIGNITSYSGFLTVNQECDSNLFFWFFPAEKANWKQAPLVLWLQGGPGAPSLYGLFDELGPFKYHEGELIKRKYSWNVENNLLFIDQPVGVGYSFTGKGCYPRNETHVGADLYEAVVQFHQLFPSFQRNKFFITGESYAGHYIPALGHTIHKNNPRAMVKINLVAMMIGNGWFDPVIQADYGSYLYKHGLIDDSEKETLNNYYDEFVKLVTNKLWEKAASINDLISNKSEKFMGRVDGYNYQRQSDSESKWANFVQLPTIRKALHAGKLPYQKFGEFVYENLEIDSVQSVKTWVEELLEVYPIIFYNGQLDTVCPYPTMIKFLRSLSWMGEDEYLKASRTMWCVGNTGGLLLDCNVIRLLEINMLNIEDGGSSVECFQPIPTKVTPYTVGTADAGSPLFLTPLLRKGLYKRAQRLAGVNPDIGNITSYSGFLTVNKECDSNLFFWFFPAEKANWKQAPLVLWLQGGPGAPSLYGLFNELGPFKYHEGELIKRKYSWNVENNLLFIDQPVGVGYSFTGKGCYPRNETHVGADLYEAVVQFHQLFPSFQRNKFFITGESYAGHYIPALGHTIHKNNPRAMVKINLVAMMIGNGWFDPVIQADYGSYLYQHGLIDDSEKETLNNYYYEFVKLVTNKSWEKAASINDLISNKSGTFMGRVDGYNYVSLSGSESKWTNFVQQPTIRKALHAGKLPYQIGYFVGESLFLDTVQSVKTWVEELLEEYPIIFYNGQLDTVCPYPTMIKFLRSLSWRGEDEYLNATRTKWCVGNDQAGYYKGTYNLYDVLVRDAGHMVPADQSHWAYVLVNSVTSGAPGNPLHALTPC